MSRNWRRNSGKAFTGATGPSYSTAQQPAKHGTHSGYVIHRAFGEEACDECKQAHAAYSAVQRERRRGADVELPATNLRSAP